MRQTAFTRAEARAKVGRRVRTRVAFAGVLKGALGTILRVDHVIDGDDVEIAWGRAGRRPPWINSVTMAEDEAHLMELPSRGGAS
jgi:hypothetical protein